MLRATVLADGGPSVGLGHLRRCMVLGRALAARGIDVSVGSAAPEVGAAAAEAGFTTVAYEPSAVAGADIVVVDGYGIGPSATAPLMEAGSLVVQIDDLGDRPLAAHLVVNPNGYADPERYPGATALCGLRYSLVDPSFVALRAERRPEDAFLVSFGGGDDGSIAVDVARAVAVRSPGRTIHVVAPRSLDRLPPGCLLHVGPDMQALMARSTVYVGAAGGTAYEAMAAGLAVVACAVVDNQQENAEYLRELGATVVSRIDPDAIAVAAGSVTEPTLPPVIDGAGPSRISDAILRMLGDRERTESRA